MKGIRIILLNIVIAFIMGACTRGLVPPGNYSPVGNEVEAGLYGCWIELELNTYSKTNSNAQYAGELIAVQNDNLFLLMLNDSLHVFPVSEIQRLKLAHYKYGAGNLYAYGAGLFFPNLLGMAVHSDYAGSFFGLGIPVIVSAGLGTLINFTSSCLFFI